MPDLTTPSPDMVGAAEEAAPIEREFTVARRSQGSLVLRRFLQHKLAVASIGIFLLLVFASVLKTVVWHYASTDITDDLSVGPSGRHPMGTDSTGHDLM
ncbi:MAG: transporter permease, partial [Frankiales bacterium]|nr:transporter permease [Frankiales bacterium]